MAKVQGDLGVRLKTEREQREEMDRIRQVCTLANTLLFLDQFSAFITKHAYVDRNCTKKSWLRSIVFSLVRIWSGR